MCVDKIKCLESFKKFEICQKLHLKVIQWTKNPKKCNLEKPHHYRACSPVLTETILENLLKYNIFSRNFDDYSEVVKVI